MTCRGVHFADDGNPIGKEVVDADDLEDLRGMVMKVKNDFRARDVLVPLGSVDSEQRDEIEAARQDLIKDLLATIGDRPIEQHINIGFRRRRDSSQL